MWRNIQKTKNKIMPLIYASKNVIVFDTETTGLGEDAKIIQFSGVRYQIDENLEIRETDMLDLYINPQEPLSEKIVEITGITDDILREAELEDVQFEKIKRFMESADLWAAYNCSFDLRMLRQMEQRLGRRISNRPCIDVLQIARDLITKTEVENHKLCTVTGYMFPEMNVNFHSAIEDVKATAMCFQKLIQKLSKFRNDSGEKVQAHLEWAAYNVNPRAKSQRRIKLKLNLGEYGDIFWDIKNKCWNCKSNTKAKKLFESLDMANIEQQVINRYAWGYHLHGYDMELLAVSMEKAKTKKASL